MGLSTKISKTTPCKIAWSGLLNDPAKHFDAKNIANILFDPSPEIKATLKGNEALERALKELQTAILARNAAQEALQ
jgi:hypothetical protein